MSLLDAVTGYLNQNQWQNNARTIRHNNMPPHHPVRTLREGQEHFLDQVTLTLTRNGQNQYSATLSGGTYNNVTHNNLDPITLADSISSNSYVGDYRDVWHNPNFQQFYRVRNRSFEVLRDGREVTAANFYLSAPCMICGICLPFNNMHIDHQRPQQGGGLQAILKALRFFGLTVDGPKGQKGQLIANPGNVVSETKEDMRLNRMQIDVDLDARKRRYTLSDLGTMYFSLFVAAGARGSLEDECKNSFFNLRPLCVSCNTSLGANGLRRFV